METPKAHEKQKGLHFSFRKAISPTYLTSLPGVLSRRHLGEYCVSSAHRKDGVSSGRWHALKLYSHQTGLEYSQGQILVQKTLLQLCLAFQCKEGFDDPSAGHPSSALSSLHYTSLHHHLHRGVRVGLRGWQPVRQEREEKKGGGTRKGRGLPSPPTSSQVECEGPREALRLKRRAQRWSKIRALAVRTAPRQIAKNSWLQDLGSKGILCRRPLSLLTESDFQREKWLKHSEMVRS